MRDRAVIDLHVHSTFSDGSLTPTELAEQAAAIGLRALALTDHDTLDGVPELLAACRARGITGIPGVEISVEVPTGTLHLLGYGVDPGHPPLREALAEIREGRRRRNARIFGKLAALGMPLAEADVERFATEGVVGRPHIAQAMAAKGYVADRREAFERFLGRGKPAYADRFRLSPEVGIRRIREAGGVAVLAHPYTLGLSFDKLKKLVAGLKAVGLGGIEVYYPMHDPSQVSRYLHLAKRFDLAATGGSDFHGAMNPDLHLGVGFGSLRVPDSVLEALERRRRGTGLPEPD